MVVAALLVALEEMVAPWGMVAFQEDPSVLVDPLVRVEACLEAAMAVLVEGLVAVREVAAKGALEAMAVEAKAVAGTVEAVEVAGKVGVEEPTVAEDTLKTSAVLNTHK